MSSSAIPPAPPPAPVQSTAASPPVLTVVVSSGAEALAKLPAGALVTAALQAVESRSLIQVTTSTGETLQLRLPPNLPLPANAELSLQVIPQGESLAFKLLAVNGRPFPFGPPLGPPQMGGGLLGPGAMMPGTADLLAPGMGGKAGEAQGFGRPATIIPGQIVPGAPPQIPGTALAQGPLGLTATVIRPAPAGSVMAPPGQITGQTPGHPPGQTMGQPQTPPAGLADLPPGTQLTVRIAGIALPGSGAALPPLTGQPPQQPSQPQQGQPQQNQPQSHGESPEQGGRQGASQPLPSLPTSPTPAQPSTSPPPAPPSPGQTQAPVLMNGAIVSHSPGGTSLVQTPAGLLSLPSSPAMPVGSSLQLEVLGPPKPPPAAISAAQPQGLGTNGWPNLEGTVNALAQMDQQAAEQLIRTIPQANPRLAAAMSLFASAVRSGDFKLLASDGVTRGLDRAGRRDLADRLKKDFLDLTEDSERPRGDGDWQVITLPFAHGAQIDPIRLFVQRVSGEDESRQGGKGQEQRFILEVQMSRLGRIQFDGLIQKDNARFDLIIRSAQSLGPDICRDIAGIFAECAQMTGVKGTVGFQSGRSFVELPPCDAQGTRIIV